MPTFDARALTNGAASQPPAAFQGEALGMLTLRVNELELRVSDLRADMRRYDVLFAEAHRERSLVFEDLAKFSQTLEKQKDAVTRQAKETSELRSETQRNFDAQNHVLGSVKSTADGLEESVGKFKSMLTKKNIFIAGAGAAGGALAQVALKFWV